MTKPKKPPIMREMKRLVACMRAERARLESLQFGQDFVDGHDACTQFVMRLTGVEDSDLE